jgi:hypothetical protein
MRSFIFPAAFALVVATGAAGTALAGSTGWGDASNGNGYYHESNGKAVPNQVDQSKKPAQGSAQPTSN